MALTSAAPETYTEVTSWADQQEEIDDEAIEICLACDEEPGDVLDLATFKTQRCNGDGPTSHDSKCCRMYHHRYDRRRPPTGYAPEPCEHEFLQDQGNGALIADDHVICPFGDQCGKCHNIVELLYHPQVFKRRLCMDMLEKDTCPRGALCGFAHSRAELEAHATVFSPEEEENPTEDFFMYRYKTQWCPQPGVHDWDACIYAHTKRDMRRTPNAGYSTRRCPDWEKALAMEPKDGPTIAYEMCCPRGSGCHMAHGVKEVLYHPAVYRMKMCSSAATCRGPRRSCCAFAHSTDELRSPCKTNSIDKKMRAYAVNKEQPQFFVPLTFASFKDHVVAPKAPQELPRTPSPQAYHREIPCTSERNAGYCTGQALQQAFQNQSQKDPLCTPMPYDQCMQQMMPNQECVVQNTPPNGSMYMADRQGNWVDDPCMQISSSPCNVPAPPCNVVTLPVQSGCITPVPPPPAQSAIPSGWRYCWDEQGNMHMWPENSQQGSSTPNMRSCYDSAGNIHMWPESPQNGSYLENSMIELSPKAAQYNVGGDRLRSDTMGSWGSSTTAPSTASFANSSAESLRSESMGSSSGSTDSTPHRTNHMFSRKPSFLGMFKEKLKSKPKGVVVPRRF
eukprot:gnl/MRDRNA2_/MRDRNA2_91766_c0_seq1.p1 gnl/MRDRNA2_/MRDRNA2_91766_c0~~gnl/MRDRNA2_/MRDRNA2_91766_c0_seq1.p1  ORF type:complete len:619 (-),score=98.71 gnl/MRDRNA2_/MRDRNA2_91766_c0_seq1:627-2483(-)